MPTSKKGSEHTQHFFFSFPTLPQLASVVSTLFYPKANVIVHAMCHVHLLSALVSIFHPLFLFIGRAPSFAYVTSQTIAVSYSMLVLRVRTAPRLSLRVSTVPAYHMLRLFVWEARSAAVPTLCHNATPDGCE